MEVRSESKLDVPVSPFTAAIHHKQLLKRFGPQIFNTTCPDYPRCNFNCERVYAMAILCLETAVECVAS